MDRVISLDIDNVNFPIRVSEQLFFGLYESIDTVFSFSSSSYDSDEDDSEPSAGNGGPTNEDDVGKDVSEKEGGSDELREVEKSAGKEQDDSVPLGGNGGILS
ncbi:hypothetical protein GH714_033292 [Hevea brasiliensis]|uniref:Uncharacterized protein n=1 Tax=Hevea brasiliensis TaxID=3981 RepID=A0A6A6LSZ9_HEVBR|nr:hypothetical protein GH714_033292 [Hevea brasiliensis]